MVSTLGIVSIFGIWLFHSDLQAQKLTISINHDEVNDIKELQGRHMG